MKKISLLVLSLACITAHAQNVSWLLTQGDRSKLLHAEAPLTLGTEANNYPFITVDTSKTYQAIDGFGFALTGSSAQLINHMPNSAKAALLDELFGPAGNISVLRISIGASDLSPSVFSYDDVQETDESLAHFDLGPDKKDLIPLLQAIIRLNPKIKIMASPWSAPAWMKDNKSTIGGSLLPQYYGVYAQYMVRYLQAMEKSGIKIEFLTVQNEPEALHNNPSMGFTAEQQASFVKNNLGPALKQAGLSTKIIIWDHNCDHVQFPLAVLKDAGARQYINGTAFHLYAGDINAMSQVHNAFPDKQLYFTEQYTGANGDFGGDLKWHMKNVVVGSLRNWSRTVIEWNLANDPGYGPHTEGGCSTCKGALTISGSNVSRNVSYYVIMHLAKLVPTGSKRVYSSVIGDLNNIAFVTPDGRKVLVVENDGTSAQTFNIRYKGQWAPVTLAGGAVASFYW